MLKLFEDQIIFLSLIAQSYWLL